MNLTQRRAQATRLDIEAAAARLFDENGFGNVTVEQIASAAGISVRTFYRYCAGKEDAVTGQLAAGAEVFIDHVREHTELSIGAAMREAVGAAMAAEGSRTDVFRDVIRVCFREESLRARWLGVAWGLNARLGELLQARSDMDEKQALVVASAVVAAFTVTLEIWATTDLPVEELLDDALAALRALPDALRLTSSE